MARACTVCEHPEVEAVDAGLSGGESLRGLATRYDLDRSAISRHKQNHWNPGSHAVQAGTGTSPGNGTALERLELLFTRAERLLSRAERQGNVQHAVAASRELRMVTETLARIRGELDERDVTVVNISTDPGWLAVRDRLLAALGPHPEATADVLAALDTFDQPAATQPMVLEGVVVEDDPHGSLL